jgi:hypothetical protein
MKRRQCGGALLVGLLLLSLITWLGLAGASAAQVALQLAHNDQFRENAASAASAGIEYAIRQVTATSPHTPPLPQVTNLGVAVPGTRSRHDVVTRFLGYEAGLPQSPGGQLAGAHFEILSTGHAERGAFDRQRAILLRVVVAPTALPASDCDPLAAGVPCAVAGSWRRLSWQRLPRS